MFSTGGEDFSTDDEETDDEVEDTADKAFAITLSSGSNPKDLKHFLVNSRISSLALGVFPGKISDLELVEGDTLAEAKPSAEEDALAEAEPSESADELNI